MMRRLSRMERACAGTSKKRGTLEGTLAGGPMRASECGHGHGWRKEQPPAAQKRSSGVPSGTACGSAACRFPLRARASSQRLGVASSNRLNASVKLLLELEVPPPPMRPQAPVPTAPIETAPSTRHAPTAHAPKRYAECGSSNK